MRSSKKPIARKFLISNVVQELDLGMAVPPPVKHRIIRNVCNAISVVLDGMEDRDVLVMTGLGRFKCSDTKTPRHIKARNKTVNKMRRIYFKRSRISE